MLEKIHITPEKKLKNPHEELAFLRERIASLERSLENNTEATSQQREESTAAVLQAYKQKKAEEVLAPEAILPQAHVESIVLDLSPEEHDVTMQKLLHVLQEQGIKNALRVAENMQSPHIDDDFHRFLVEYIRKGYPAPGLKEKTPLYQSLHMTSYEVLLPGQSHDDSPEKPLKEMVSAMEQFYAGMLSLTDGKRTAEHMSVELALPYASQEVSFFVSVPIEKAELFEKHILSVFPQAKLHRTSDDFNIFNPDGSAQGSYMTLKKHPAFPLKTYEQFDHDPLGVLMNTFSQLDKGTEGASLQIIFKPVGDTHIKQYTKALEKLKKGDSVNDVFKGGTGAMHTVVGAVYDFMNTGKDSSKDALSSVAPDQSAIDAVTEKVGSPVVSTNVRIVTSAPTDVRATQIMEDIESSFNQLEHALGNTVSFKHLRGRKMRSFLDTFSYRYYDKGHEVPLNLKEISTMIHFATTAGSRSSELKQANAKTAPAPLSIPGEGTLLGTNIHRNQEKQIYFGQEDRMRHFYAIGQTGTGKSTLLKNMVIQDIQQGHGVCMIDPHGSDLQDVLANIPEERVDDVIYFDPAYTPRPVGLNMLEYDARYPEQKTFVVNEMLSIFEKLFDMKTAGGPMFEQYFRNSVMLAIDDPNDNATLLDISRVLADKAFRKQKLAKCTNPIVVQFWEEVAEKAGGEASLENMIPYITSKFDVFLSNDIMRPIIGQAKSAFNFRDVMDNRKILLVNLSKGRLGDINANLIGLILVGKILMAALSRVDMTSERPDFYLYIDEFQNVTTNSIATILSEARKYRLSLNVAHQFIAQLSDDIKDAVFGNVGSLGVFRVGAEDAEFLQKQFEPVFEASDIMNIDNYNAYLKLLVGGSPAQPFNIRCFPSPDGDPQQGEMLKALSYQKYGGDREAIEKEIMGRYKKPVKPALPSRPGPAAPQKGF